MQRYNPDGLAMVLSERIGLPFDCRSGLDSLGEYLLFVPTGLDIEDGFCILVRTGLSHIAAEFSPGRFSGPLLRLMGDATAAQQTLFQSFAQAALQRGYTIEMSVNETTVNPASYHTWPPDWRSLHLVIRISSIDIARGSAAVSNDILHSVEALMGMTLSLVPFEESSNDVVAEEIEGYAEGAAYQVEITKYERNPLNRAACIQLKGTSCLVCGFNFAETYGPIGEGFIHVHHLTPVSQMGPGYIVQPETDLVPVCPNCHSMLHRRTPPFTVEELRNSIHSTGRIAPRTFQ